MFCCLSGGLYPQKMPYSLPFLICSWFFSSEERLCIFTIGIALLWAYDFMSYGSKPSKWMLPLAPCCWNWATEWLPSISCLKTFGEELVCNRRSGGWYAVIFQQQNHHLLSFPHFFSFLALSKPLMLPFRCFGGVFPACKVLCAVTWKLWEGHKDLLGCLRPFLYGRSVKPAG